MILFTGAGFLLTIRNNWAALGGIVLGGGTLFFTLKSILK